MTDATETLSAKRSRAARARWDASSAQAAQVRGADVSDDTRNALGDRATFAIGRASFALAWDRKRDGYNVTRLYTRMRINVQPHGLRRERVSALRGWTFDVDAPTVRGTVRAVRGWRVRAFDLADARRGTLADTFYGIDASGTDVRMTWERRVRDAMRQRERDLADGYTAHVCPREPRGPRRERCECGWMHGTRHYAHGADTPPIDTTTDTTRMLLARGNVITTARTRAAHARERAAWADAFDARLAARSIPDHNAR